MSSNGHPPRDAPPPGVMPPHGVMGDFLGRTAYGGRTAAYDAFVEAQDPPRPRYWLHTLLLALTLVTTTAVGAGLTSAFEANHPFTLGADIDAYISTWYNPWHLLRGLPFSLTLLAILMAHEMGHYLTARFYRVDVTLPFFIPAPTLIGTMGAFIRLRSPILSKRILFDIGIAGPLAGFVTLLFPLAIGMSLSKEVPGIAEQGDFIFGTPLLMRFFSWVWFPGVPLSDISLHPMVRAVWAGLLATALNLLPIGQLDGGHILYAFLGEKTKWLSRLFVLGLIPLGIFFSYSWLVWAVLLFLFGMRHPSVYDPNPIGRTRGWLGVAALLMFVLSFTPTPVRT
jgi:membrane-associated protease RseP (regulator of RpoE activity)